MGAPTLILGLGGLGGRVVQRISDRIKRESVRDVELAILDTDVNDLRAIDEAYPDITTVQISPSGTVGKALDLNPYARENWFPLNDGLVGKSFTEGAGQVRAISRLAFDYSLSTNGLYSLEQTITKLHGLSGETMHQVMRIIIISSIAGGTGSGLVLPVAMYIRNYLESRYQDKEAIIRGFFLEPDVLFGRINDEDERNSLRANAYASVRELDAFFRKYHGSDNKELENVVFNAPEPESGEHVDYPTLLPYHFVFLMDANNMDGKNLIDVSGRADLNAYLQHAADCIYAQALSAVSARSNSSEDNVIRRLAESNGRSRYCGAGYSCLEYPKDAVQRYIAYTWAEQNIANQWMELDHEFEVARRDDEDLKLPQWYVDTYNGKRGSGSRFYETIMRSSERKDSEGMVIDVVERYIEDLENHARSWSEDGIFAQSVPLRRSVEGDNGKSYFLPLPESNTQVLDTYKGNGAEGEAYAAFSNFWNRVNTYSRIAQEEVPSLARIHANGAFSVSEMDEDPLVSRAQDWHIESIFRMTKDAKIGSFHPTAVRYYLYKLSLELERLANESREEADEAKSQMIRAATADYDLTTEETEDVTQALNHIFNADEPSLLEKLRLGGKEEITDEQADKLAALAVDLNNYYRRIQTFKEKTVVNAFASAALAYVKGLIDAYETFYRHLDSQGIQQITNELEAIELDPQYNETSGYAHRFVCAGRKSLDRMKELCKMHASSGDLPLELCGDIYNNLLKYAIRRRELRGQYGEANEVSQKVFSDMFEDVIVDYWMKAVMDPHSGYPHIVDKNIIQAIGDEALYNSNEIFTRDEERNDFLLDYVKDTLEEAHKLATPFIEPPAGELPRSIEVCAYSEEAFTQSTPNAGKLRQLLDNSYQGISQGPGEFSKYEILFYRSVYGFCATNLPKYSPKGTGLEKLGEGQYHRAYYSLVDQLSPHLQDNRLITPHIDKNWHLIKFMPDINEDFERGLRRDIVRSFLHGLIFNRFGAKPVSGGEDIFYLRANRRSGGTSLWVTNGSPCDRFYEIYDALEFSPPAVETLLESSRASLAHQMEDSAGAFVETCPLVRKIQSKAFEHKKDFPQWTHAKASEVVDAINALTSEGALAVDTVRGDEYRVKSKKVKRFFKPDEEIGTEQTSLFEIPFLYRVSLPVKELRQDQIEAIVQSTFDAVEDYLRNFALPDDRVYDCCILFIEQYLLFERNLVQYEKVRPDSYSEDVVNLIRETLFSYLDDMPSLQDMVDEYQAAIERAWNEYRDRF